MEEKNSFLCQLHPKKIFWFGVLGGLLTFGTIGFLVLGTIMLRSGGIRVAAAAGNPSLAQTPETTLPAPPGPRPHQAPSAAATVGVGHLPVKGSQNAQVTIVEFADFRCPFCQRFFQDSESGIIHDYVATGKVKYYFRHFAFLGPESTRAHEAAECANEQGKFWQFHDWLYQNQAPESDTQYYSTENLIHYATNLGLNHSTFASCLGSHKYAREVSQDVSEGQSAGVNGTPTIFINGRPLIGAQPYTSVRTAIEQALGQ